jgi:hypothetical protein
VSPLGIVKLSVLPLNVTAAFDPGAPVVTDAIVGLTPVDIVD